MKTTSLFTLLLIFFSSCIDQKSEDQTENQNLSTNKSQILKSSQANPPDCDESIPNRDGNEIFSTLAIDECTGGISQVIFVESDEYNNDGIFAIGTNVDCDRRNRNYLENVVFKEFLYQHLMGSKYFIKEVDTIESKIKKRHIIRILMDKAKPNVKPGKFELKFDRVNISDYFQIALYYDPKKYFDKSDHTANFIGPRICTLMTTSLR